MARIANCGLTLSVFCLFLFPAQTLAQGETTSAIVGQVTDATSAAIPGATVTITNREIGLQRSAKTDDEGRFDFPQLKPGAYSVRVEAEGFDPQQNDNVFSGLGQKQTVNFTLKVAQSNQTIEVSGAAPLINPENPNTSTNLNAPALENLPNPGGDLTYPLQFAAGALVNTAGSGNDFVGGTNGYGNVEFNGLPALSNGYIVDGLETNDPLTNLNSGLSTNLVLGLNSISEVTVNTLSYAVDQGRYGASQVNYVTKSGHKPVSRKPVRTVERLEIQCGRLFHECDAGEPQAAVNREPLRRQRRRSDYPQQAVLLFRQRVGSDCASHRHGHDRSNSGISRTTFCSNSLWVEPIPSRVGLSAVSAVGAVLSEDVFALRQYERNASRGSRLSVRCGRRFARNRERRKRLRESPERLSFERRS